MSAAIDHRGPDDSGIWLRREGRVVLGHRRLSIVDLSLNGHQPMTYGDRFTIVFNGEIYNHRALRRDLIGAGRSFVSQSDTEVVMAGVAEWGLEETLQRLVGMFAFALWDERYGELSLVRDRLGEKPLFIATHDGCLFFASELRAMETVAGLCGDLSEHALSSYLIRGYVPEANTMWRGVHKLPQSCLLRVPLDGAGSIRIQDTAEEGNRPGEIRPKKYWSLPQGPTVALPQEEAIDELERLLSESVSAQLQCDVPVGVFLSGGFDSAVIAALAQRLSRGSVSTFTVKFGEAGFDESAYAEAVAKHLGTSHHEIQIEPHQIIASVAAGSAWMDEPIGNASYFALRTMAREARQQVKVALSGDGGDELFAGYNRYRLISSLWRRVESFPMPVRRILSASLGAIPSQLVQAGLRGSRLSGQLEWGSAVRKYRTLLESQDIGEAYLRLTRCWQSVADISRFGDLDGRVLHCTRQDFVAAAMALDILTYLPGENLAKADRATMAEGLELRVPLLDHRIVEFSRTLPLEYLIRSGHSKWILRQVAYRHIPRSILDRPKMGFTVPVREWLVGPLRKWAEDLLHSESILSRAGLRREAVARYWSDFSERGRPAAWELWTLVVLLAWIDARKGAGVRL